MELTAEHVNQTIPKQRKHVSTFVNTIISPLTVEDRQQYASDKESASKMPMFSVTEGERNYVYSFNRIVERLDAEIKSRRDFFDKQLTISVIPLLIVLFVKVINSIHQTIEPTNFFNLMIAILFGGGVYATAQTIYRHPFKAIKKLKAIKTMVFDNSTEYLTELEDLAKQPVINI